MTINRQETFSDREELIKNNPELYFSEDYFSSLQQTLLWLKNKFLIKDVWLYKNYLSDLIIAIWLLKDSYSELQKLSKQKEELSKWKNQLELELSTLADETKRKTEEIISSWKKIKDIEAENSWYKSIISDLDLLLKEANKNIDLLTSGQLDLSAQNKWLRIKIKRLEAEKENIRKKIEQEEINKKLEKILPEKNKKYKKILEENIEKKYDIELKQELLKKEKEYKRKEMKYKLEISNLKETISILEIEIKNIKQDLDKEKQKKVLLKINKLDEVLKWLNKIFDIKDSVEYKELEKENESISKENQKLKKENKQKEEIISNRDETISQRDEEIERLKKQLEESENENKRLNSLLVKHKYQ